MEEARRGEGEKRKMDDLVSGEEKRRGRWPGRWCDWRFAVRLRALLEAAGFGRGSERRGRKEGGEGEVLWHLENGERRTTTRFGQSIEAVRSDSLVGCLPEEGRSRGLEKRICNSGGGGTSAAFMEVFRWWSALWWCWSEQVAVIGGQCGGPHNIPAEAKALSSTSASYFREKQVLFAQTCRIFADAKALLLHQHNIYAEARRCYASAQHFARSKDIIRYIGHNILMKQMRYLLHQHHIFAEAKALSSASAPYFTKKGVTFYISTNIAAVRHYLTALA
ncbi:hypothetical protein HAX54_009155 [Datura stramonium]|uniref:Uncharacterized protein n=1 Tax=Datura stramonium TaxID=4076 RepID=A0ABS8TFT7_DATST|nr:hypothetical protein [Datura stramonium]